MVINAIEEFKIGDLVRIEQQTGNKKPNWILIKELRRKAYDIAEELAEKLRRYERQNKRDRTNKISTGFPKPVIFDKDKPELQGLAEKRFKDKYVVNIRKNTKTRKQHLEGILAAMGLVTVIKIGKEYRISMTDLGKEFYLLDNPVLNGDYTHAFSDDEVECIKNKIIPQRELEHRLVNVALERIGNFDDERDEIGSTPNIELSYADKLNIEFEKEFRDFVKSYNDNSIHKEKLEKEYIKKGVESNEETPITACRVATMGRLSELGLVNWIIEKDASSRYSIKK